MSAVIPPAVLSMILCEEVVRDPQRPGRPTAAGLLWFLGWPDGLTTPLHLERLVVLLILTDGRGIGRGRIACINEETGQPIFGSEEETINFRDKSPALPFGKMFTLQDCRFPVPGAYQVQFVFEDEVISRQPLIVR